MQFLELAQPLPVEVHRGPFLVGTQQFLDVGQARAHDVAHRQRHRLRKRLCELAYDEVAAAHDLALVVLELAGDQFERRRFPRAVAADQAHALARVDGQVGFPQDHPVTESERDLVKTNQCHRAIVL